MLKKTLTLILVGLCCLAVAPQVVAAKEQVLLSPAFIDLGSIDSSRSHELKITLYNQTSQAQTFSVRAVVLALDLETDQLAFAPNNAPDISHLGSLAVPEVIRINPGQSYEVEGEFKLSSLLAPGSHQFALLFQPQVANNSNTNLILGELAAIVNFTSGGALNYKADMNLHPVPNPSVVETPELKIEVSNQGNAIIQPQGVINVQTIFGIPQTFNQNFNDQAQILFQGQTRGFDVGLELGNRLVLGLYQAEAVVAYGPQHKVITRKTNLFIIPWYFLAMIVGILGWGLIIYYKRKVTYANQKV